MATYTTTDSYKEKRLERATRHVSDYWFPANSALVDKIKSGLDNGQYESNIDLLMSDLKSDFSLFTSCLRGLLTIMKEAGEEIPSPIHPIALLEESGLERLKQILEIEHKRESAHALEAGNDLQIARFQEAMLSASAAEVLSESCEVDADTAYASALLRQLGYALIAWNYPGVYQEAVIALKTGDQLDVVLAQRLGFSPILLAMRVLHSWDIPLESMVELGLVDQEEDEEGAVFSAVGSMLSEICKVGEALARANSPIGYPGAESDWIEAQGEIERRLGANGLALIQEKFLENCDHYLTFIPDIFEPGPAFDVSAFRALEDVDPIQAKNPLIALCDMPLQRQLRKLYIALEGTSRSKENIRFLVDEVIPSGGFTSGCIFTMDPGVMALVPQIELGQLELRKCEAVDYSIVTSKADIVAVAYRSNDPVVGFGQSPSGAMVSAIVGIFGEEQRVGVLYLETPGVAASDFNSDIMIHYRAIRQALNDCLSL
ncbi:HDOD domain-containing protein [Oligoflexia bacterium]|nr:HDOD domain-containing protein [Oligoflexia bacterium]